MECLVVGDAHLTDSHGGPPDWEVPQAWGRYDVLLLVGDLLDRSAGTTEPVESFLAAIDALGVPAFTVPGNHDYPVFDELLSGHENVVSLDGRTESVNGWSFYGMGSDRFDDGPEIRYPHWPSLPEESPDDVESAVRSLDGQSDRDGPGSVELYTRRENRLASLAADCSERQSVLLSHLPPFGSGVDTMGERRRRYGGLPWGSISVRTHVERFGPEVVACGHIHEAAGIERLGETLCVNPGRQSVRAVRLTEDGPKPREK